MPYQNSNGQISSSGPKSRFAGYLLAICLIFITGFFVVRPMAQAANSGGLKDHKKVKTLRMIAKHSSKHVCTNPKKPGRARCMAEISTNSSGQPLASASPAVSGYGSVQFHTAYQLPCTPGGAVASVCSAPGSFGPQTIAIVDAGNFSSDVAGLNTSLQNYDQNYGLPACSTSNGCLKVVNQSGAASPLPADAGWSDEIALDVEVAHMICQTCKIILVEADDANLTSMAAADATAASFNPTSISNSWGSDTDDPSLDGDFNYPGIAVVAATGDNGTVSSGASWPSDNPNVVAVSGTTLQLFGDNTWAGETVWSGSGGGCSDYYSAPSWQSSLSNWAQNGCGSFRAFGDVSAAADPNTGAAINVNSTWYQVGGTSLATPIIASIFALTGGVPSGTVASTVPYTRFSGTNFHDVTTGSDCVGANTTHCNAAIGFDTPSGLGTPNGLNGFAALPSQPALSATTVDQTHINLSWTASTASSGIAGYHIYRNGSQIATTTDTTYGDTGLTPNTTYSYYVVAYDNSSNASLPSNAVSAFSAYPSDINEDGHIDLLDLSLLASKYGQCSGSLGRANINSDSCINLLDFSLLAGAYGSE
ncbi:MAG TPA: hypothetical protein VFP32_02320 [Candidatus Saccharimonadales bacterium]|nr:hypothetical protein [Candidatus Saccharimonadales bacterium]